MTVFSRDGAQNKYQAAMQICHEGKLSHISTGRFE